MKKAKEFDRELASDKITIFEVNELELSNDRRIENITFLFAIIINRGFSRSLDCITVKVADLKRPHL